MGERVLYNWLYTSIRIIFHATVMTLFMYINYFVIVFMVYELAQEALGEKVFVFFIHIIKCQSINYNSVKFQVNRLRNQKVTIYRSTLSYQKVRHCVILILCSLMEVMKLGISQEIPVACFGDVAFPLQLQPVG